MIILDISNSEVEEDEMPVVMVFSSTWGDVEDVARALEKADLPEELKSEIVIIPMNTQPFTLAPREPASYIAIRGDVNTPDKHILAIANACENLGLDRELFWADGTMNFYADCQPLPLSKPGPKTKG